ncbi:MAG: hypothetical protein Q7S98_01450 [Deltaproteobacteria bacterium]|nr:hypothetical protein [Deltaproteobacteria bacterium]
MANSCPATPQALTTLPAVSHAYLSLKVKTDATGAPMMPVYDEAALKATGIDVSIFKDTDAVTCLAEMVAGNPSLRGSLGKAIAAVKYFREGGNTDSNADNISWGELAAGYAGQDPRELRNAAINIQSAVGLVEKARTMMTPIPPAVAPVPVVIPAAAAAPATGPTAPDATPAATAAPVPADAPSADDLRAVPSKP